MSGTVRKIDHLTEDSPIQGQQYVCLSFLSPEGIRNCKVRGLKIRGVYATREEADKRAEELRDIDKDFHVFVGEIGKWLPWDPDPNSATDQNYKEEELQNLMESYKKNRKHVKELETERKDELKKNAKVDSQKQSTINRLRQKLEIKKEQNGDKAESKPESKPETDINQLKIKTIEADIKEQEEIVKNTKEEIKKLGENDSKAEDSLENNLSKISSLYKEIHN